jgi:hypothetical protein
VLLAAYLLYVKSDVIPLIVQCNLFTLLCITCFLQHLFYDKKWRGCKFYGTIIGFALTVAPLEAGLFFALKAAESTVLTQAIGILSAVSARSTLGL